MIHIQHVQETAILTLDRVDRANALTQDMLESLLGAVQDAHNAKLLILTGAGHVFSAGADLDEVRNGTLATSPLWEQLSGAIAGFRGMSIAALNGTVAGGAMGMVLACDLRICVPAAKFFYPVMRLGVLPQPSDPMRLASLIGPARSKMILMGGQKIAADRALSWGLVEEIQNDPLTRAQDIAQDVLAAKTDHIHAIKSLLS